jgi:zinc transport system substrate-binding protein
MNGKKLTRRTLHTDPFLLGCITCVITIVFCGPLYAEGVAESAGRSGTPAVVASTGWAAAFAYAAGAEQVRVLAPYELRHPPEYELRPSDIRVVSEARYIVYAGYEAMVDRLVDAAGARAELIRITTQNDLETIRGSVIEIARRLGTVPEAERNLEEIARFFRSWKAELDERKALNLTIASHAFQAPLLESLGLESAATFGPAPLEANLIRDITRTAPDLIVDNEHNPVAGPIRETNPGARYVAFINFPASASSPRLIDILAENRRRVEALFDESGE